MAKRLQHRGGTTSQHSTFTGAVREVTVDTDKNTLVVHDGATAGGHALPTITGTETLTNKTLTSPVFSGTATNFTSTGIDDNATSTAITIDSSENVGINTASPNTKLTVTKSDGGALANTNPSIVALAETLSDGVGSSIGFGYGSWQFSSIVGFSDGGGTYGGGLKFLTAQTNSAWVERMRIDSSGNVGIGTAPATNIDLHIRKASPILLLQSDDGQTSSIFFGDASDQSRGKIDYDSSDNMIFSNNNLTERMRIDSSGNVLVGKTTSSYATDGITLNPEAILSSSNTSQISAIFNRNGTDGDIVNFRKDGTTNGQIGVRGNTLHIGSDDVGLEFHRNDDKIYPTNPSSNTLRDNSISLGGSSNRFKDLYLGGGLYVGGTGTANKLDDYEEGTFTPIIVNGFVSGFNYAIQGGKYTKIGNKVFFALRLEIGTGTANSVTLQIGGLPFATASSSGTGFVGGGVFSYTNVNIINSTTTNLPTMYFAQNQNLFSFYKTDGSPFNGNDLSTPTNADFYLMGYYFTDA